ncbi:MAG: hypothetical protein KBB91_00680 [Candidatus Pacebacteria bacterium]|nr:hypothetical protein [Candidatus Paceibacterota bacterium]MBP9700921.1 hypothetical protein [Candidatus Paceibacterota bacterium]
MNTILHFARSRSRNTRMLTVAAIVCAIAFFFGAVPVTHASPADNMYGYAWSANIGWIKMNNCTFGGACTGVNYGVNVEPTGSVRTIRGYAWSANIGWISFEPAATSGCPDTNPDDPNCQARLDIASSRMKGWARACSVFAGTSCSGTVMLPQNTGGWDGFISLADSDTSDDAPFGIRFDTIDPNNPNYLDMSGFAWGSTVVGWVDFSQVKYRPTEVYECSDDIDNLDTEDTLIDIEDPGCHTDGDPLNDASYDPYDPSEQNSCLPGQPCWCLDPAHAGDDECKERCEVKPWLPECQGPCEQGDDCWCENPANYGTKECQDLCKEDMPPAYCADECSTVGSVCWCTTHEDPICDICTDPNTCPGGGTGQCTNIPDDIEVQVGMTTPPSRPYRKLPDGRCLCVAGYVLDSKYICVKPEYNEF